jgi:uncharacterized protein (TIGR03067 family)
MRTISSLIAVAVLGAIFTPGWAQGDKDDAKKLQGAWVLTKLIIGGIEVPEKDIKGTKFVFEGDKLTVAPANPDVDAVDKRTFKFKLDPKQKPAAVDLTALDGDIKGAVSPGIYELSGDTLRWCQSDDEKNKERPKTFESPDKSRIYVFTFKRAPK